MRKVLIFLAALVIVCAGALGVMTSKYLTTDDYASKHFPAGYIINGVRVYDMDYDTALRAFEAGARQLTHTYNAMPQMAHRQPGPIPAGAECGADAELIADGVHVHPAMVRLLFRLYGREHIILISDSLCACGLPEGEYGLGGLAVTVRGKRAVLTEHPDTIAGSVTCLYDCMKEAVLRMGIPLEDAVCAASENPARAIGVLGDYGRLVPGAYANVILADRELNIRAIFQKGKRIR